VRQVPHLWSKWKVKQAGELFSTSTTRLAMTWGKHCLQNLQNLQPLYKCHNTYIDDLRSVVICSMLNDCSLDTLKIKAKTLTAYCWSHTDPNIQYLPAWLARAVQWILKIEKKHQRLYCVQLRSRTSSTTADLLLWLYKTARTVQRLAASVSPGCSQIC